jgi:lysophospholipase L1-like esterase
MIWAMVRFGVMKTVVVIAAFSLVLRCVGAYFPFINIHINPVKDSVFARADDFAIGAAIAWFYARGSLPKLGLRHVAVGLIVLAIAGVLWDLRVQQRMPLFLTGGFGNLQQVGIGILIIAALNPAGRFASVLSVWPLRVLGAMCFSIYCWHALLLSPQIQGSPFTLSLQVAFWATLLCLAAVTYRFIEFPNVPAHRLFMLTGSRSGSSSAIGVATSLVLAAAVFSSDRAQAQIAADWPFSDPTYLSKVESFRGRPQVDNAIIMLGDSITDLGAWSEFFPEVSILNRGISGDTTIGVEARLDEIITRRPAAMFLMIGTNDIFIGADPGEAAKRLAHLVERIRVALPATKLFVQSAIPTRRGQITPPPPADGALSPKRIAEYNARAREAALKAGGVWIDLTPVLADKFGLLENEKTYDGIHLNAAGYRAWVDVIKPLVQANAASARR